MDPDFGKMMPFRVRTTGGATFLEVIQHFLHITDIEGNQNSLATDQRVLAGSAQYLQRDTSKKY